MCHLKAEKKLQCIKYKMESVLHLQSPLFHNKGIPHKMNVFWKVLTLISNFAHPPIINHNLPKSQGKCISCQYPFNIISLWRWNWWLTWSLLRTFNRHGLSAQIQTMIFESNALDSPFAFKLVKCPILTKINNWNRNLSYKCTFPVLPLL